MIIRKSPHEVEKMAAAGAVVATALEAVAELVRPGVTTHDLDQVAERVIAGAGATPSFRGYRGFPASLCTSVNDEIVHGIPSRDRRLAEGDVVKVDCGAIVDGYHGDSAVTWIVGGPGAVDEEVARLVDRTRRAMYAGLVQVQAGARLGDIGHAIESVGRHHGYGVVREYVGHGIGRALHEDPAVPNHGEPGRGAALSTGWVLAIEPMFNLGTAATRTLDDGWTVVTADGRRSAHWEHTVALTEDGPRVLTARSDEPSDPRDWAPTRRVSS